MNRKLAAIVYADVAGYSRMMGEDEEGTLATFTANMSEIVEPAITRHYGRVVKTMGDGFLAEFSSPVSAARATLQIQDDFRSRNAGLHGSKQQWFRIGLALGDVKLQDGDIFGGVINIAARLQSMAEPGSICASAAIVEQLSGHTGLAWTDLGEKSLKNIARPVRVYRLTTNVTVARPTHRHHRLMLAVGAAAIVVLVVVSSNELWKRFAQPTTPISDFARDSPIVHVKPSVAVLPLVNQSGDPSTDYFSDGITEGIISALGRFSELTVMAYNATRPYKGKATPPGDVGRDLGVRYLVEGSVRRAGDRVRVSIRLIAADSGAMLWPEQFDEQVGEIFVLEDRIARRVAGTLVATLTRVEQQRALAKPTDSLGAYDLALRGRSNLFLATRAGNREARQHYERALELDPKFAAAHSGLGLAFLDMAVFGWTEFPDDMLSRAEEHARKALSINSEDLDAHRLLSKIHKVALQYDRALTAIDRVVALNPSYADAHAERGDILLWSGNILGAISAYETAFSLDPNLAAFSVLGLGLAYYSARRHEDAVRFLDREALRHPDFVFIPIILAAAYGQLGRTAEAQHMAQTIRRRLPVFDPRTFGSRFQKRDHQAYLIDGLHKAGLN